ncbi:MAG TPA: hypothetical protein VFP36_13225, partial [Usitatibacter sp.]|nr:hypothetical protein [Usitatibacter sp.]
ERVASLGEELKDLVGKHALAQGGAAGQWFLGWAQARSGRPDDGYRLIRAAYEENTRLGMLAGGSEVLGYAVEALLIAGDLDRAQEELEQALEISRAFGERVYLPQLLTLEAAIARARGDVDAATVSARRAIEEARTQQAPWLELMALLDLCESKQATRADRGALAELIDRMPQAKDMPAVAKARAVLSKR